MNKKIKTYNIDRLKNKFSNLERKKPDLLSTKEAINTLAKEIRSILEKGYSVQDVWEMFNLETKSDLKLGTFISYVNKINGKEKKRKISKKGKLTLQSQVSFEDFKIQEITGDKDQNLQGLDDITAKSKRPIVTEGHETQTQNSQALVLDASSPPTSSTIIQSESALRNTDRIIADLNDSHRQRETRSHDYFDAHFDKSQANEGIRQTIDQNNFKKATL